MNQKPIISRSFWWLLIAGLVLFAPIALLAGLYPPNKYLAQDMVAVDCDSPGVVMLLALSSYVVYGAGALGFGMRARRRECGRKCGKERKKRRMDGVIAGFCIAVIVLVTPNAITAYRQHAINHSDHAATCGQGW